MAHRFGLIGRPVGHSFSQRYFEMKWRDTGIADRHYSLCELPAIDLLPQLLEREQLDGFNVTAPYKTAILPLLDRLTDEAREVGAVNCVAVTPTGLMGHNTDCQAFADTLKPLLKPWHTSALVLGTGGASRAVAVALRRLGIGHTKVSRTPSDGTVSYPEAVGLASSNLLIINATPVGMAPRADASPWPVPEALTPRHLVCDLIYNPSPTLLMRQAAQRGAATADGLAMLYRQADLSEDFWLSL